MANHYTQFSLVIHGKQNQIEDLFHTFTKEEGNEYGYACDVEMQKESLWLYSWEDCDLERIASILAEYQEKYHLTEPIILEWANTCSKLRTDGFSGGAVAVYKGTVKWFNPYDQASRWIAEQKGETL